LWLGAMYKNLDQVRIWGSKVKGQGHQAQKKTKKCGSLFWSRPQGCGPHVPFFSGVVLGGVATLVGKSAHAV